MPYDDMVSNKTGEGGGGRLEDVQSDSICHPK